VTRRTVSVNMRSVWLSTDRAPACWTSQNLFEPLSTFCKPVEVSLHLDGRMTPGPAQMRRTTTTQAGMEPLR
jgi:hypothetical protein